MFLALLTQAAQAFCGFYVGGAGADLYNDATLVVLLRDGTKTVLSMQNSYEGPPESFAMVVPVPEIIDEGDVKTLPREVFARVDQLASPRLVEYWERDPCYVPEKIVHESSGNRRYRPAPMKSGAPPPDDLGVTVEAEFAVAEYDIVILSASDSAGLDTWLRREGYAIPEGAETVLRGYVQQGTRFFVAKVDADRVTFDAGRAVLSPLRITYDDERFGLPVRLGLLNSKGEQDLLVHILAKDQRYEVANRPNVTIPTNLRVQEAVKTAFGGFYEALFAHTLQQHPRAVVTEYAWQAGSCDPCPGPTLDANDLMTLGGDVAGDSAPLSWTLTRLHARTTREGMEDLVFQKAGAIVGGRGTPDASGRMTEATQPSSVNQFQGRYAILHPWEGEIACKQPQRGVWGGPGGSGRPPTAAAEGRLTAGVVRAPALHTLLVDEVAGVKAPAPAGNGVIPELSE